MVPALAADAVSRVEKLGHEDVAEVADGEERGGFHLDDDRPLGPPRLDLGTRLAEDGVGRPGLAEQVRMVLALEHLPEDLEAQGIRRHLAAGREVVIRGALVTNRGGGNDDPPHRDRRIEHPGAAASDDHSGAMSDRPLEQARGQGRSGAGMKEGDAALAIGDLIDGVLPHLAALRGQRNQVVAQDDVVDDVLEETRHRQFRDRYRCDRAVGLDQRRPLRIEFEDGVVVGHVTPPEARPLRR